LLRIEARFYPRKVGGNHRFQPTLRLRSIEPVLGVRSERMAVRFQLADQRF